jgi:hypothetical protein
MRGEPWLKVLQTDLVMLLVEVGRKEQLLIGLDRAHRAVNLLPVQQALKCSSVLGGHYSKGCLAYIKLVQVSYKW